MTKLTDKQITEEWERAPKNGSKSNPTLLAKVKKYLEARSKEKRLGTRSISTDTL